MCDSMSIAVAVVVPSLSSIPNILSRSVAPFSSQWERSTRGLLNECRNKSNTIYPSPITHVAGVAASLLLLSSFNPLPSVALSFSPLLLSCLSVSPSFSLQEGRKKGKRTNNPFLHSNTRNLHKSFAAGSAFSSASSSLPLTPWHLLPLRTTSPVEDVLQEEGKEEHASLYVCLHHWWWNAIISTAAEGATAHWIPSSSSFLSPCSSNIHT